MERKAILMSLAFLQLSTPKTRRREGRQMNVGPGITAEFPVLTDEQVASVARPGTRHHTTAGEVLDAAGERGYDFIVIEAAEVDVLRPAMPNAPEALIATWAQIPGRGSLSDQEQAPPTSTRGTVVGGEPVGGDHPPVLGAHRAAPAAGGPAAAGTRSSR
jgi:hypothetical protein